jgi:protein-disulfide isomerase
MRDVLLVSRWFYPAGTSVLIWLTACVVVALISLAVKRTRKAEGLFAGIATTISSAGVLVCLGLIVAEVVVFELGSPFCIGAYVVLLGVFAGMIWQGLVKDARGILTAVWFVLASGTLTYLFFFGAIPHIIELKMQDIVDGEVSNVLGSRPNTLSVTEFADFECPPCASQDRVMDRLWSTYSDRIRYTFRHLPKPRHPHAESAALASHCAAEQGVFWETKRLLFANQERLGELLSRPDLATIPSEGAQKYAQCVASRSAWPGVSKDLEQARKIGLRVTPSIIVGNKLIEGTVSYPRLALIVRRELGERNLLKSQVASGSISSGCAITSCSE